MDQQYNKLLEKVLKEGIVSEDRTGVGTISSFGEVISYDLSEGFPAVTTKKLAWKSVVAEVLWMLEGSSDERRLAEFVHGKAREEIVEKTTVWTANANAQGVALSYQNDDLVKELGPVYGVQMRKWDGDYDQFSDLLKGIKENPNSRRHILSLWNANVIDQMALPPCSFLSTYYVRNGKISCMLVIRSNDLFLGHPFNVAQYALITHMIAKECGLDVGELKICISDAHIYTNHVEQVIEQISRVPYKLPTLAISDDFDLTDRLQNGFRMEDVNMFSLENYQYHPTIKASMAV